MFVDQRLASGGHRQLHFAGTRVHCVGDLRWSERQWGTFSPDYFGFALSASVSRSVSFFRTQGTNSGPVRYPGGTGVQYVPLNDAVH